MSTNTYTYDLGNSTYVNLTNRCTNDCAFCVRHEGDGVGGYDLWLDREPSGEDVIAELAKTKPRSVVFCGFGEPTLNLPALLETAAFVKSYGGTTRINTNGHANLFHDRDVTDDLRDVIDEVSISLNAPSADSYVNITHCRYGSDGFTAMLDFARKCLAQDLRVTLSVVDVLSDAEIDQCRALAEGMGASFRIRPYVA